jgi:hypothetical protein
MIGLLIISFFIIYLLVSMVVVGLAASSAKKRNRSPWRWGGLAAFVMYSLLFWDLVPTLVIHKYYCSTEAGLWVYKTPEQWMAENPKIRLLDYQERGANDFKVEKTLGSGTETSFIVNKTSRIKYLEHKRPLFFLTENRRVEETLYDEAQKTYLARKITYEAGHPFGAPKKLAHYKFWVNLKQCVGNNGNAGETKWQGSFNEFMKFGE